MCGIVGYAGNCPAAPILLEGLEKLEYRGYDSAGICVHGPKGLEVAKAKGRLAVLKEQTRNGSALPGNLGIGHTRWATHGAPSDRNSHPHLSDSGKIAVVHNGIIENEARLRQWLEARGVHFHSETDTEVISNLVGWYYERNGDFLEAVRRAVSRLEGSFALGILCADAPDTIIALKKDSPLIFGFGEGAHFIASDVPAILKHTRTVEYMEDGEMAIFTADRVKFLNAAGDEIEKQPETISWALSDAEREGYDSFMLKEIFEQPRAIRETVHPRIREGQVILEGLEQMIPGDLRRICFIGCGSAHYVSVLGKYILEKYCRIPVEAVMASEFRYCDPVVDDHTLVVVISQSGETADSLAALREAKGRGAKVVAIVNVVGSAISKEADHTIYTWAGPEIAVATTKAFSTQLSVIYLLAAWLGKRLGTLEEQEYADLVAALLQLPEDVQGVLSQENLSKLQFFASRYYGNHDAFFVGRNVDSAVCMEGSLKLKEIAYLHSEAYPAGELKHGPISLIEQGTLVVALAMVPGLFDKTMSNVREVCARGADVLCLTLEGFEKAAGRVAGQVLTVPQVHPLVQPSLSLIPLQLLAYYIAVNRGCDVDKPRNLAKSVTVE